MEQTEFIKNIIDTLSKVRASDKAKHDFASYLSTEIRYEKFDAQDKENYTEVHRKLTKATENLIAALKAYKHIITETKDAISNPFTPLGNFSETEYIKSSVLESWGLDANIGYYEMSKARLDKYPPPPNWPPHRDYVSYLIAKFIAEQYHKHFGTISTGKGEKNIINNEPKRTPYDRVCMIVGQHYEINFTPHILREAAERVKHGVKDQEKITLFPPIYPKSK